MDKKRKTKKKLKLSTPEKTPRLNFIFNKEVVIQVERLSESVIAEMTAGGSALPPEQAKASNDDTLDINSLPNEIIVKIFAYLEQNQLGQMAQVCRRWNVLTKCPVLWKRVNVKIFPSDISKVIVVKSFINGLPSCVTSMRLDFVRYSETQLLDYESLDFRGLSRKLQKKCPHLEELTLINCVLSDCFASVLDLCIAFLQHLKKLIFYRTNFHHDSIYSIGESEGDSFDVSQIKILELYECYLPYNNYPYTKPYSKYPFTKLRNLEQLHLYDTQVDDSWFFKDPASLLGQLHVLNMRRAIHTGRIFQAIRNHGHNLKELYLCLNRLHDHDLTFTDSVFPHLKTICLSRTFVTCEGFVSLIQSCPSLQNVYVSEYKAESFAAHPFAVANRCKSGIVKAIHPKHDHTVDYSHSQF